MDEWFDASEKYTQPGSWLPMVASVASFATKHDVNTSADSLPCSDACIDTQEQTRT